MVKGIMIDFVIDRIKYCVVFYEIYLILKKKVVDVWVCCRIKLSI